MIPAGEVTELLVQLIRNECVNDGTPESGHEYRSVETLASYFGTEGEVYEPIPGRTSVVYRVPGTDPDAPRIMLMGHLDVVPVTPSGWSVDPFGGERSDGFVWGRGAVDMLNLTSAMAVVFKRHLDGKAPRLPGDLIYLGVADEEHAGVHGAKWLVDNRWDDIGCEYLLTEIGTPALGGTDGKALPITVAEKGPQWRRFFTSGTPGHGSQPYGSSNALAPLASAIARLAENPTPVDITPEWVAFVEGWDPPPELRAALLDPDRVDEAIDTIALDDPGMARWVHACTHLTVSPNVMRGGMKANVIADAATAEVDIRALPGQDEESVFDYFRKAIGPEVLDEIEVQEIESFPATGSPTEGPLWDALTASLAEVSPGARLVPSLIPVATDARFFRPKGTIAYGVGLFDDSVEFGDFLGMFHGHDERVSEVSLGKTADLLAGALDAFGTLV